MESIFFEANGQLKSNPNIPDNFALFGLAKTFNIDLELLEVAFEERIFTLHPDFFTNAPKSQKFLSLKFSAILKQAKDEIANSFSRAVLLCKLLYRSPLEKDFTQPQDFLIFMLEVRESLVASQVLTKQKDLIIKLRQQHKDLLRGLAVDFELFAAAKNKSDLFCALTQKIGKIQYYKNIEEQIESLR